MKKLYRPACYFACLLIFLLVNPGVQSQPNDKPPDQWTLKEVEAFLTASAWAHTIGGSAHVGGLQTSAAIPGTYATIRLRSGLPVRQALARLRQLKSKYDKLSAGDKAAIDDKNKPLLDCAPCEDYYVISMSPGPGSSKGVPSVLKSMSLNQAKQIVMLKNEEGETRELVNMVNPQGIGDDAVFFFARFDAKGKPLFTTANRKVILWFDPIFQSSAMRSLSVDFDVAKITVNGQVLF